MAEASNTQTQTAATMSNNSLHLPRDSHQVLEEQCLETKH